MIKQSNYFHFFKKILFPYKWHLLGWLTAITIWSFDSSIKAYILKMIIDAAAKNTNSNHLNHELTFAVMLYAVITIILILVTRFYNWITLKITPGIKKDVASNLVSYITGNYNNEVLQDHMMGSISNRINDVVYGIPAIISDVFDGLYFYGLTMIFTIVTIWQVDYRFSIITFTWIATIISINLSVLKKSKGLSTSTFEEWTGISGKIVDIVYNVMNIRFFSRRNYESNLLNTNLSKAVEVEQDKNIFFLKLYAVQSASFILMQGICLWMLVTGLMAGKTSVGDFSLVLSINTTVSDALYNISKSFLTFTENLGKISQGLKIIQLSQENQTLSQPKPLVVSLGKIEFENVCFHYKGNPHLFYNKNLVINAGAKIGLAGYSGSGKSTFVNLILRTFNIQSGRILIDGQDISMVTQESICDNIAIIPQEPPLFHRTIKENIRYGKLEASDEEIFEAAKKTYTHDFIERLPEKYDSMVGDRGVKISGGQKQRIAITRAILKDAPIIILDEATSGLDSLTDSLIQKNIRKLFKNKTTIIIAHRLKTLTHLDKIFVFDQGVVVEEGSHAELIAKNGVYKRMWDAQTTEI